MARGWMPHDIQSFANAWIWRKTTGCATPVSASTELPWPLRGQISCECRVSNPAGAKRHNYPWLRGIPSLRQRSAHIQLLDCLSGKREERHACILDHGGLAAGLRSIAWRPSSFGAAYDPDGICETSDPWTGCTPRPQGDFDRPQMSSEILPSYRVPSKSWRTKELRMPIGAMERPAEAAVLKDYMGSSFPNPERTDARRRGPSRQGHFVGCVTT